MRDWLALIQEAISSEALDTVRVQIVGKNGALTQHLKALGKTPSAQRAEMGRQLNVWRKTVVEALEKRQQAFSEKDLQAQLERERIDVTLSSSPWAEAVGGIHPLSRVFEEIAEIFEGMGFVCKAGPDIESEHYNFEALNIPAHHPARLMHDTFYLEEEGKLLRTHTSSVQIRTLETEKPPLRIIAPGRVYRDDYDATHTPMFHQVEGMVIDRAVHMGHLKSCLEKFLGRFFGERVPMRFRPSYFPFTEPSAEVDIMLPKTAGREEKWLEILGCGMVHPKVLRGAGVDTSVYQGFAFGLGVERLAMLKYNLSDLRAFFKPDVRWVRQFRFSL